MLKKIVVKKRVKRGDFLKFMSAGEQRQILNLAANLKGKKILHINATEKGGGVVEILNSLLPYLQALGIKNEWYAIAPEKAGKKFFIATDKLRDALQGQPVDLTSAEWRAYRAVNKKIAEDINNLDYDILVINDYQLLFAVNYLSSKRPRIYISHVDTFSPYKRVLNKVAPAMKKFRFVVFSNRDFVVKSLHKNKVRVFAPAIDPLVLKQTIVPKQKARRYLKRFGVPENRPLIVQVSRFDIWKNPLGVIESFRIVQQTYPQTRLALVGFHIAKDNPKAFTVYRDVASVAKGGSDIFLFFHPRGIGNVTKFAMMAQNAADVVVQNSTKEGFGLVVTEAMWKSKAVIGGPASGIRRQIQNGKNGFIVKTPEELADRIVYLISHPEIRKRIGKEARRSVKENFLFPRFVLDHLKIYKSVIMKK